MILINFKIYKETFGDGAIKLAEVCKKVMETSGVKIIPVVSTLDANRIMKATGLEVWLQHVDPEDKGAKSGYVSRTQAQAIGIGGSLLNHSEHKLKPGTVKKMLKSWPADFKSVVCLQSWGQAEGWARNIRPTYIAYEPRELIGNRDKSVASEKPEMIKKMAEFYKTVPLLVGAGVHSKEDVQIALKLGAKGILVATDVVKASDPEKELRELAEGFKPKSP